MESERIIPELLTLLRENIEEYWLKKRANLLCESLCVYINILFMEHLITLPEYNKILEYIKKFRPSKEDPDDFWWPVGELQPRIEFLDKLINDWKNMSPIERKEALGLIEVYFNRDKYNL